MRHGLSLKQALARPGVKLPLLVTTLVIVSSLLLAVITTPTTVSAQVDGEYEPPHNMRGPAVDRVLFKKFDVDEAAVAIRNELMDIYFFGLKVPTAKRLIESGELTFFQAPSTMVSILLNPAEPPDPDEINPFYFREIRFALQFAVNREEIVSSIYQGLAYPMYTHVTPIDYDYVVVYDIPYELGVRYDLEYARSIVEEVMRREGAELRLEGGREVWYYKGRPVTLKFVVRVEDERREVGKIVAEALESLGFKVILDFQQFAPAIQKVYSTDPQAFEWNLYTEGWARRSVEKYDSVSISQFCAPWFGNMPGWRQPGWWQYENEELDELTQRIFKGEFRDEEERRELYRRATLICLDESVRIWVVNVVNVLPASPSLEGISLDLAAGPRSIWSLRSAYVPGRNELVVGNLWVLTPRTTWNPVGGFTDVYSTDIWLNIYDPPIWSDPFNGVPQPFRVSYRVETAGPDGRLSIPEDAVVWDAERDEWVRVGGGKEAISKVVFDYSNYFNSKWHHGVGISMSDVLYQVQQLFELAYDDKKRGVEFVISATLRPYADTIKAVRLVGENELEVYVDYWHFVPDYIASYASIASLSMPWEVLAAMDSLVFGERVRAAYSDTAAARFNVPWLNLVIEGDARLVRNELTRFLREGYFPEKIFSVNGRLYETRENAMKRYEASINWFNERRHMVISNGPFYLSRFGDIASQFAELVAFRDETYPYSPSDMFTGVPEVITIEETGVEALTPGRDLSITLIADGPDPISIDYLLVDPSTLRVITRGSARAVNKSTFEISIPSSVTKDLTGETYKLIVIAYSGRLASPTEKIVDLGVVPEVVERTERAPEEVAPVAERAEPQILLSDLVLMGIVVVVVVMLVFSVLRLVRRRGAAKEEYEYKESPGG